MEHLTKKIPDATVARFSCLYEILGKLQGQGVEKVTSAELGRCLGQSAITVRKDIHYIGAGGTAGAKYPVSQMRSKIADRFGFDRPRSCCIVGLGRIGSALLEHLVSENQSAYKVVAGFDSNINRLETIHTPVELFPAYRIEEVVRRMGIDIAVIAVPQAQAQEVADRCCDGGVRGLLNFTPTYINPPHEGVTVRSVDILGEVRILAALTYNPSTNN